MRRGHEPLLPPCGCEPCGAVSTVLLELLVLGVLAFEVLVVGVLVVSSSVPLLALDEVEPFVVAAAESPAPCA